MYSTADVIYGVPITRKIDQWLQEHWDDEDVQCEEFEQLGFEVQKFVWAQKTKEGWKVEEY